MKPLDITHNTHPAVLGSMPEHVQILNYKIPEVKVLTGPKSVVLLDCSSVVSSPVRPNLSEAAVTVLIILLERNIDNLLQVYKFFIRMTYTLFLFLYNTKAAENSR